MLLPVECSHMSESCLRPRKMLDKFPPIKIMWLQQSLYLKHARQNSLMFGLRGLPTLFSFVFVVRYSKLYGFKSLAYTTHPFLAAGTAKGPMPAQTSHCQLRHLHEGDVPANTSHTISSLDSNDTILRCSA